MPKQLFVSMEIGADASQAKKELAELQQALAKVAKMPAQSKLFDDVQIKKASQAAIELQAHLQKAFNAETGKLDLSKFSSSLKASKTDITKYAQALMGAGQTGQEAFLKIAQSISAADMPLRKTNAKLVEFATTLKNTARWQISSSILHGFMGTLQSAYGYAQDLNESLNNIRIVTGQTTDQMAQFAKQANEAAKALSTTTTRYTDAALIFYQQGLTGDAVTERTDAVIKLSNVTGESAEDVSSYMTAIWNNFDNGSVSLEHYADVLTALGASTASSTAEIAAGLEKFAAIADVTGLSYEYATSALATLVANTRQSADTVGNSLKTIFSRLQGLKLGETLDDGVDLNKYSEALNKVGVSVLDASGEMRNMDNILDDLAGKWDNLNNAEKMALAQTVAGVRQYNNLISLMDNWDDMQTNLSTAQNAEGALQEQADIYAESWEASQKRVKAALEEIYSTLLDEDFFIGVNNGLTKILDTINGVIKGFGGIQGIATTVGSLLLMYFANKVPNALDGMRQNFMIMTGKSKELMVEMQNSSNAMLNNIQIDPNASAALKTEAEQIQTVTTMRQKMMLASKHMTESDKIEYEQKIKNVEQIYEELKALRELKEEKEKKVTDITGQMDQSSYEGIRNLYGNSMSEQDVKYQSHSEEEYARNLEKLNQQKQAMDELETTLSKRGFSEDSIESMRKALLIGENPDIGTWQKLQAVIEDVIIEYDGFVSNKANLETLKTGIIDQGKAWKNYADNLTDAEKTDGAHIDALKTKMLEYAKSIMDTATQSGVTTESMAEPFNKLELELAENKNGVDGLNAAFEEFENRSLEIINQNIAQAGTEINRVGDDLRKLQVSPDLAAEFQNVKKEAAEAGAQVEKVGEHAKRMGSEGPKATYQASAAMTSFASAAMSTVALMNSVNSTIKTFSDKGATGLQKLGAAVGTLMAVVMAANAVQKASINIFKKKSLETIGLKLAEKGLAVAEGEVAAGGALIQLAFWPLIGIMTALVAIFALFSTVSKKQSEDLKNNTEAAEKNAEAHKKNVEALEEEKNKTEELESALRDLQKQYKNHEIDLDTLNAKTYNLCLQYELESLWVKSLTGDYKDLEEALYAVKIAKDTAIEEEAQATMDSYKDSFINKLGEKELGGKKVDTDKGTLKIEMGNTNGETARSKKFRDALNELGLVQGTYGELLDLKGFLDWYAKDPSGVDKFLNDDNWKNLKTAKELKEYLKNDSIKEYVNNYTEAQSKQESARQHRETLESVGSNRIGDNEHYNSSLNTLTNKILEENYKSDGNGNYSGADYRAAQLEANRRLAKEYGDDDNVTDYSQKIVAANTIAGQSGLDKAATEKFEKDYGDLWDKSPSTKELLKDKTAYITFKLKTDPNFDLNEYIGGNNAEVYGVKAGEEYSKGLIEGMMENQTKISSVEGIAPMVNFEEYSGFSEEEFLGMDYARQSVALMEYYAMADQLSAEQAEKINEQRNKEFAESEAFRKQFENDRDQLEGGLKGLLTTSEKSYDEVSRALINYAESEGEVSEADQEIITYLKEDLKLSDEQIESLSKKSLKVKENKIIYDGLIKSSEQVVATSRDYVKELKNLDDYIEWSNNLLDSNQAAYKTLSSAMEEYNENGYFSLDTAQELIKLGPEYLKCLEYEDGQFKLNTESLKELTKAEILNQQYALLQKAQRYAELIEKGEERTEQEQQELETIKATTFATFGEVSAMFASAEAKQKVINANEKLSDSEKDVYNSMITSYRVLMDTWNNIDKNFDKMMGGSSKSSSKSSKNNQEKIKYLEDEIDKYHIIKNQIQDTQHQLDLLSKAKDRAFGKAKLKMMDEEIAKNQTLIAQNKEYLREVKANVEAQKAQLKATTGAQFDGNGTITNYDQIMANATAAYNDAVVEYNHHKSDDEKAKTAFEAAKKTFEDTKKLISSYESDQDLEHTVTKTLQDLEDKVFDAKLAEIDYVVEIKLDVDDRDIKYLEYILEELEDLDFNAAEALVNISSRVEDYLDNIQDYEEGINNILALSKSNATLEDIINGDANLESLELTEDGLKKLEGYIDGLFEMNKTLRDMRENAWAQINEEFTTYLEKIDRSTTKIEHLQRISQSYSNMIDIVGKKFLKTSNTLIEQMHQSMVFEAEDLLRANKAKFDAIQESYNLMKAEDTTGWSDQAMKERRQLLEQMEDELNSARETFMSSWEDALQSAADAWSNSVSLIIEEFSDKIAGMRGSISELQAAYDRSADIDAEYLEDFEQIYQLTKLTRDINKAIDDTDNIASKRELLELVEEINQIEADGTKLSEYDLEVLQKKFELKQAQLALEEAQNAKSSVSMVRGEDGSYSYLYTADENDVADAEQNYEDKLHEMQVLNADYIKELQENIIQAQQDCADALSEIKASDYASYEEYRAAVEEVQNYYGEKMRFFYSQMEGALGNNRELYENDWREYSERTGYKISADEDYIDKFEETNYAIITGFTTIEEAHSTWNQNSALLLGELSEAYLTWQENVHEVMELAGTSVDGFASTVEGDYEDIRAESEELATDVEDMKDDMVTSFEQLSEAIGEWERVYGLKINAAIEKNSALQNSYNHLKKEMAEALSAINALNAATGQASQFSIPSLNYGQWNGGGGLGNGGNEFEDTKKYGIKGNEKSHSNVVIKSNLTLTEAQAFLAQDRRAFLDDGLSNLYILPMEELTSFDVNKPKVLDKNRYAELHNGLYAGFDTGGYTGDWGNKTGKLAILHEKELVLNADDTRNILSVVDMVREIAKIIDLNAAAASGAYGSLSSSVGVSGGSHDTVQQIEIHAEFPSAVNHSEIEEAFMNLSNMASQYANRY